MTDFGRRSALHDSTHEDGGVDEISAALLVGRINYVDRGDPTAYDFSVGDFITDAGWHDIDLSSIVPAGTKAVHLWYNITDDEASISITFRNKSKSYGYSRLRIVTQVADIAIFGSGFVTCDSNRKIQYIATNTTFSVINLLVLGWFI